MNPESRDQPAREDRRRATAAQQMCGAFQRGPESQRVRHPEQRGPAHRSKDFATDHGADDGREEESGNHGDWIHGVARNRNAGDHQQQIARRKRHRDPALFDEDQPSDDEDQQVAAQARDGGDGIHEPSIARAAAS